MERQEYKTIITADKYRWSEENNTILIPQYRFMRLKRFCNYWKEHNKVVFIVGRIVYEHYKRKYNTDIPASTQIGFGCKIRHLGGIVINPGVVIGNNVDILNGVLLGQMDRGRKKGTPTIGNNVFIGTNAIVVGKINIGDDVVIAPGSYVNFDVPSHSIIIGNPGKIIARENAALGQISNIYREKTND